MKEFNFNEDDIRQKWQDQKSGVRNFEPHEFAGFLKDLPYFEWEEPDDWKYLFSDLENGTGFIDKLVEFYQINKDGNKGEEEGRWYLYFSPLRRNFNLQPEECVDQVKKFLMEQARIIRLDKANALAERIEGLNYQWVEPNLFTSFIDNKDDDFEIEISEVAGDWIVYNSCFEDKNCSPESLYCLKEACYFLAASEELAQHLMTDFCTVPIDYSSWFQIWNHGVVFCLNDQNSCIVSVSMDGR